MSTRTLEVPADAVYRWSWGALEPVRVYAVNDATGAAYVDWPESVRELDGRMVERPTSWTSADPTTGELGRPRVSDPYVS